MTPAAARMLPLLQRARSSSIAVSISSVTACGHKRRYMKQEASAYKLPYPCAARSQPLHDESNFPATAGMLESSCHPAYGTRTCGYACSSSASSASLRSSNQSVRLRQVEIHANTWEKLSNWKHNAEGLKHGRSTAETQHVGGQTNASQTFSTQLRGSPCHAAATAPAASSALACPGCYRTSPPWRSARCTRSLPPAAAPPPAAALATAAGR